MLLSNLPAVRYWSVFGLPGTDAPVDHQPSRLLSDKGRYQQSKRGV
jgi:hypothetical protein